MVGDLFSNSPVPEFYVNAGRVGFGAYDFVFDFGVLTSGEGNGVDPPLVKPVAVLRMSPQHALVMANLLNRQLVAFEAANGKINVSEQVRNEMEPGPQ